MREKVFFGRKGNDDSTPSDGQRMLDAARIEDGGSLSALYPEDEWIFGKPLQALHISILREYLDLEFSILKSCPSITYDLERIIDDFIFLCFFVGESLASAI